jgi:serine/threonine protein kinase
MSIYQFDLGRIDYRYGEGIFIKPPPLRLDEVVSESEMKKMRSMHNAAPDFVPRILGVVKENGRFVTYALEEVQGMTITKFLSGYGNPHNVPSIIHQGDEFFRKIHRKGLHHDDAHGSNFMITPSIELKVIDAYSGRKYKKDDSSEWRYIKGLLRRYQRYEGIEGVNCARI